MHVSGCRTAVDNGQRFCHDHVGVYEGIPLFRLLYRTLHDNVLHVIDTRKHTTQQSIIQVQDHEIAQVHHCQAVVGTSEHPTQAGHRPVLCTVRHLYAARGQFTRHALDPPTQP
jgi:hypothetical protein